MEFKVSCIRRNKTILNIEGDELSIIECFKYLESFFIDGELI